MTNTIERADYILDEHLIYLDILRESGETNMYGATPYIRQMFVCSEKEARSIQSYWMETFAKRHPAY